MCSSCFIYFCLFCLCLYLYVYVWMLVKFGTSQECQHRLATRRPVTLPWLTRVAQQKVADLESTGWQCYHRGAPFKGSRSWVWMWLCKNGYLSRQSGNKRPHSPEIVRQLMTEWLHFLREEVLYPPGWIYDSWIS